MIILLCGLSGAGKTTLSRSVCKALTEQGVRCEILDGDECRSNLFKELGFSQADRVENMRRLAYLANKLSQNGIITVVSAINPFDEVRKEIRRNYRDVSIVHIDCALDTLRNRDTKGLYARSGLPDGHPDKVYEMTGVSQRFDVPDDPDLTINTGKDSLEVCTGKLMDFINKKLDYASSSL